MILTKMMKMMMNRKILKKQTKNNLSPKKIQNKKKKMFNKKIVDFRLFKPKRNPVDQKRKTKYKKKAHIQISIF